MVLVAAKPVFTGAIHVAAHRAPLMLEWKGAVMKLDLVLRPEMTIRITPLLRRPGTAGPVDETRPWKQPRPDREEEPVRARRRQHRDDSSTRPR